MLFRKECKMKTFGEYIKTLRTGRRITMKDLANQLGITAPYLNDVEKGRRDSFDLEKLNAIAKIFELSDEETNRLMNLAGEQRNSIAPDLPEYIVGKDYVTAALRKAKDLDVGEKEWLEFIERLSEKGEE
nr:helix-turn-helix transcriptional regulator [Streptococcus acidominimus]